MADGPDLDAFGRAVARGMLVMDVPAERLLAWRAAAGADPITVTVTVDAKPRTMSFPRSDFEAAVTKLIDCQQTAVP